MLEFHSIEIDGPDGSTLTIAPHLDLHGGYPDVQFTEEAAATVVTVPLSTQQKLAAIVGQHLRYLDDQKKQVKAPPLGG
jgi:hypothetical protein